MKKTHIMLLAVICFFSIQAIAQKPAKLPREISVSYDKFKDHTRIDLAVYTSRASQEWISASNFPDLAISYDFDGSTPKDAPSTFQFIFDANCSSRYCFHDDDEIIFLIDGERVKRNDPIFPGNIGSDRIVFEMSRAELERLAKAKVVEFQISHIERSLKDKQLKLLQTFLDYSKTSKF